MKSAKIILCSLLVTSLMSCLGIRLVDASTSEYSRYVGFGGDFVIPGGFGNYVSNVYDRETGSPEYMTQYGAWDTLSADPRAILARIDVGSQHGPWYDLEDRVRKTMNDSLAVEMPAVALELKPKSFLVTGTRFSGNWELW